MDEESPFVLHRHKEGRVFVRELELGRIEQVEDCHIVAKGAQAAHAGGQLGIGIEKVGYQDGHRAPPRATRSH